MGVWGAGTHQLGTLSTGTRKTERVFTSTPLLTHQGMSAAPRKDESPV